MSDTQSQPISVQFKCSIQVTTFWILSNNLSYGLTLLPDQKLKDFFSMYFEFFTVSVKLFKCVKL